MFFKISGVDLLLHISNWNYPWSVLTIKLIIRLIGHEKMTQN